MLTVSHNNALLESFHVRHLGYDISNIALANVGLAVFGDHLEKFSPPPGDFYANDENFSKDEQNTTTNLPLDYVLERQIKNGDSDQESFFVCDVGIVVKQFLRWKAVLPRITPFYAIKCNTDKVVLETLVRLGAGFDCASKAELAIMLEMGVDPSRIIYANPCKPGSHIRYAREKGIRMMTFDNLDELVKIKQDYEDVELVLRIVTDDSKSAHGFSLKFGASLGSAVNLLEAAKAMQLKVVGVSFHVGSGCQDASLYNSALKSARFIFDKAFELGFDREAFNFLDIGGGFPGVEKDITLEQIASVVNAAIDEYFPSWQFPNLRIISEPGRYFATEAFTLAVSITSRRVVVTEDSKSPKKYMYYLAEGVYGSFNCIFFDHAAVVHPQVFTQHGRFVNHQPEESGDTELSPVLYDCTVWGPTCDSIDLVFQDAKLPELDIGDWLVFKNMGAYTICAASTFNGFSHAKVVYINKDAWRQKQKCDI